MKARRLIGSEIDCARSLAARVLVEEQRWQLPPKSPAHLRVEGGQLMDDYDAVRILERANGLEVRAVVPVEIGAINSVAPALAAHELGVVLVDADGAGRAVPTLSCLTFATNEALLASGCAVANETAEVGAQQSALFRISEVQGVESVVGAVISSATFGNLGALAIWMIRGAQLKQVAIPGGLSRARSVGRAIREARARGRESDYADLVVTALRELGSPAKVIAHELVVRSFSLTTSGSIDRGTLVLERPCGATITVYTVNENMIVFDSRAPTPLLMVPDLACLLLFDGTTLDNSELKARLVEAGPGRLRVQMIGVEAPPGLVSHDSIVAAFAKLVSQLGYGGCYVPFEAG